MATLQNPSSSKCIVYSGANYSYMVILVGRLSRGPRKSSASPRGIERNSHLGVTEGSRRTRHAVISVVLLYKRVVRANRTRNGVCSLCLGAV